MFDRLSWKIICSVTLPVIFLVLVLGFIFEKRFENSLLREVDQRLEEKTALLVPQFSQGLEAIDRDRIQAEVVRMGRAGGTRITLILADGMVLADSDRSPQGMDNHRDRPEVLAALSHGAGRSRRSSVSVNQEMIYFAHALRSDGKSLGIVRLSLPAEEIDTQMATLRQILLITLLFSLVVTVGVGLWLNRHIAQPIRQITRVAEAVPRGQAAEGGYGGRADILGALGRAIKEMGILLRRQVEDAEREEEKLDAILNAMTEGVIAVDNQVRVLFCNPSARELLGITTEEVERRILEELIDIPPVLAITKQARMSSEAVLREFSIYKGGKETHVIGQAKKFGGAEREGVVVVLHDMSEARRLERIRKDFVENASHELRTPLAAIKGYVETLRGEDKIESDKADRFLEKISRNVDRLVALTSDLLSLSRIEAGSSAKATEVVECGEVVRGVVERYEQVARKKGIKLSSTFPEFPITVSDISSAITDIVDNLVDNALKYTDPSGRISILLAKENGYAIIQVEDTGVGIPLAEQPRIFERFYRVDKARSMELGGTGLGLSIVKHHVTQLQGTIDLQSTEGKGSCFTVRIPMPS